MTVTMAQVAKRAGVSPATVSRVLRNNPHVADNTRKKVLRAIDELDYRPNLLASALMTKKTYTLGLLVPDVSNPFFAEVTRSIEDAAAVCGYHVIVCNTDDLPERESRYIQFLIQKGVDGFIAAPSTRDLVPLRRLIESGYPVCLVARDAPPLAVNSIRVDDFQGAYQATRHLIECGHSRLAMIAEPGDISATQDRMRGYRFAIEEAEAEGADRILEADGSAIESGTAAAERLLAGGERPSAVFCANDMLAVGLMHGLRRAGLTVPRDVSVVGFDGTVLASAIDPPLTTVVQPVKQMGRMAVEVVRGLIDGESREVRRIVLQPVLRRGESTMEKKGAVSRRDVR